MRKKGYRLKNFVSPTINVRNNLEHYHLNHLKLLQLLTHGDIESNPGPVTNNVETAKIRGRPPKKTSGFNFKGKKLNFCQLDNDKSINVHKDNYRNKIDIVKSDIRNINCDAIVSTISKSSSVNNFVNLNIDYSIVPSSVISRNFPIKLRNENVNVCFFNSICQVLYSIPAFHSYLEQTPINNLVVNKLKDLFRRMTVTNGAVQTSTYISENYFSNYTFGQQHDAQEALSEILNVCYPNYDINDCDQHIFRVKLEESIVCDPNKGGCGASTNKYEYKQIIPFQVTETNIWQNVDDILINSFGIEIPSDYKCNLGPTNGCGLKNTCNKTSHISKLEDIVIIHLLIFTYDAHGNRRKIFPNFIISQHLDQYSLQSIIWHHGDNLDSGHYTSMVKHNHRWHHISDTDLDMYPVKFLCERSDENSQNPMVPYLLFYVKNDLSYQTVSPLIDFTRHVDSHAGLRKRDYEAISDDSDDHLNTAKVKIIDLDNQENKVTNVDEIQKQNEKSSKDCDSDSNVAQWKLNFSRKRTSKFGYKKHRETDRKRKIDERSKLKIQFTSEGNVKNDISFDSQNDESDEDVDQIKFNFSPKSTSKLCYKKHRKTDRKRKMEVRGTDEGKIKQHEIDQTSKMKIRATDEGKLKNQETAREGMKEIRNTDEGKIKQHDIDQRSKMKIRNDKKAEKEKIISNLPFPPIIDDEQEKESLRNFIRSTSSESMKTLECAICGEAVMNKDLDLEKNYLDKDDFVNRNLLLTENQENQEFIPEYVFDDLLLSPGGVIGQSIICCNTCLSSLNNNKLPKFSIANGFQIGKTPPQLTGLTLSEKLLISKCRPKMYVVKLRSTYGPQAQQRGLKGNTITFPQNVVKIAATLPANPEILVDHLKVVFIGKDRPSRELLKKVFTVRSEKVYNALNFLIDNNPVYSDVTLSNSVDLPADDVPEEIMNNLVTHDDLNDEDANEHSTYTPQTDLDDIPSDTVIMDSVGMVDLEGSNVKLSDQMNSAISTLQGASTNDQINSDNLERTMIVPHGSVPVNEYNNPNLWLGAYPWLYPYGKGGPETQRQVKVGLRAYMKHILKLADRKFSLDPSLKFHAFNVIQKRDVSYHTSLHVRRPQFHSTASHIQMLTPESMEQLLKSVQDKTPITDPNLRALMDSLSTTGKHVNGSPYQKSTFRKEIFSLMIYEGTPVLWITLSPAVTHSPIFLQIAGHNIDISEIPAHVERAKLVANDPVAAAIYFNEVIDAFTKYLLGYKNTDGGIFGHPSGYYGMTEEQGTGTLHNHMLVWLYNFKSVSKLNSDLEDEIFQKKLIEYLERIIKQGYLDTYNDDEDIDVSKVSCKYPVHPDDLNFHRKFNDDVNKLVKVANTHSCRSTCYKYRKTQECRFEFPRELVPQGKIEGNMIKLKRTNEMINNYNPYIMTCIRSNHDVKFIPSGKDGKNIAFYVTNYATKSQLSTHNMVPLIAASKKRLDADPSNSTDTVNVRAKAMIT